MIQQLHSRLKTRFSKNWKSIRGCYGDTIILCTIAFCQLILTASVLQCYNRVCWHLEVQTRQFAISDTTYAVMSKFAIKGFDLLLIFLCSLIQTLTLNPSLNNPLLANMDMWAYACGDNGGGRTVKKWLVLPHLECPQWPLPLVFPSPHAHDPHDMHLLKESLLFRMDWLWYSQVSCNIRNDYSICFHIALLDTELSSPGATPDVKCLLTTVWEQTG